MVGTINWKQRFKGKKHLWSQTKNANYVVFFYIKSIHCKEIVQLIKKSMVWRKCTENKTINFMTSCLTFYYIINKKKIKLNKKKL